MLKSLLVFETYLGIFFLSTPAFCKCGNLNDPEIIYTDRYWLEADSVSGAKGDVVGVTITLNSRLVSEGVDYYALSICHDLNIAELVGEPQFSDEISAMLIYGAYFWPVDTDQEGNQIGHGAIIFFAGIDEEIYNALFPSDIPLPLMTLYYRLKGDPGTSTKLSFCNWELERFNSKCNFNFIHTQPKGIPLGHKYVSTLNMDGNISVVEGLATTPERPPSPPEANIYSSPISPEDVNFAVRLTGAVTTPGESDVPVDVIVTSNFDSTGIFIPIDFDERYLRLSRVENNFMGGIKSINTKNELPGGGPEEGNLFIATGIRVGNRRVIAAGEEYHAARLFFDILPAAIEISETFLRVVPITPSWGGVVRPLIHIRTSELGLDGVTREVRTKVEPISLLPSSLKIRRTLETILGDADFSNDLSVTDAIMILSYLFLGSNKPDCPNAADFDGDRELTITDAIQLLRAIFLGDPPVSTLPTEIPCL